MCHEIRLYYYSGRASYKEFGHSHWWELIEIFVPKFGIWFSSLFPKWEFIPTEIPAGGNWFTEQFLSLRIDDKTPFITTNWQIYYALLLIVISGNWLIFSPYLRLGID